MKFTTRFPRLLITAVALAGTAGPAAAAEHDGSEAAGRDLYMEYQCWQCHGYEAQGGAAPRIGPNAYPWEAFVRFIRYPNEMPAYTKELLSDEDLKDIFDYLQSIPEPTPVEDIPALDRL